MRCSVCDYCEGEAKSLYQTGLKDYRGTNNRRVYYNRRLDREICTYCDYEVPKEMKEL